MAVTAQARISALSPASPPSVVAVVAPPGYGQATLD
jgi:hypothetical protein